MQPKPSSRATDCTIHTFTNKGNVCFFMYFWLYSSSIFPNTKQTSSEKAIQCMFNTMCILVYFIWAKYFNIMQCCLRQRTGFVYVEVKYVSLSCNLILHENFKLLFMISRCFYTLYVLTRWAQYVSSEIQSIST